MGAWLERHREAVVAVLVTSLLYATAAAIGLFLVRRPTAAPIVIHAITPMPTQTRAATATPGPIQVYVVGAVARPGVYTVTWDSRVEQAIAAAGGATTDADLVRVNLAERVQDEQQVYVPTRNEVATPVLAAPVQKKVSTAALPPTERKIDINAATASELEALPGIGPVLAQRIVDYRQANGPYGRIEDIREVRGIGEGVFEQIKGLITVE